MLFFNKTIFKILAAFIVCVALQGMSAHLLPAARSAATDSGTVGVSALNMRNCPDTTCRIIKVLHSGEPVVITGEQGDWLEVRHGGASGYVLDGSGYIRRDPPGLAAAREEAREIGERISQKHESVSEMDRKAASAMKALEAIEKGMADAAANLERVRKERAAVEDRMKKVEIDISKTRHEIGENRKIAEERLVALYKLNRLGAMNLLATADSASDLFRRKAAIETVVARDEQYIGQLAAQQARLEALHAKAVEERGRQAELETRYIQTRQTLAQRKTERAALLAEIRSERSKVLGEIEYLQEAARRMDETIAGLKQWKPEVKPGEQKIFSEYRGLLKMPVDGKIISRYGKYRDPQSGATAYRNGIEIQSDRGAPVKVVFNGKTSFSNWLPGFGRVVVISHGDSFYTVYGHLEELFAREGEEVRAGDVIATVGDSGSASGTALYFEVRHRGNPLDPLDWIEKG